MIFYLEKEGYLAHHRDKFIKNFFVFLKDKDYSILKYWHEELSQIEENSDIDMVLNRSHKKDVIEFLENLDYCYKYEVHESSYMDMIYIFFLDGSFMEVDLIYSFVRKNITFIDALELLASSTLNSEQVKTPSLEYQFLYVYLFYTLNYVSIEPRYRKYFMGKAKSGEIIRFMNVNYDLGVVDLEELCVFNIKKRDLVLKKLRKKSGAWVQFRNLLRYFYDTFGKINKSEIITFSGVDGAGKTTVLREFKERLETKYRRDVIELRHRPSILPILSTIKYGKEKAEKRTTEVLPRSGTNTSLVSSYFRLFYYLADYILGQWLILFKHGLRGRIIIYDRYYFDFINDPKRTNINLNGSFIRFFYRFIFKPKLNIFLFAPPEVILSRKQELDEISIVNLTQKYKELFEKLQGNGKGQYFLIENISKERTLSTVEKLYVKYGH